MILFLGKEKYEGSMQSQKYSRRSIWGLSLSKMLLHFRLDFETLILRKWVTCKKHDTFKIYYMVSVYSQQWTEKMFKMFQSLTPQIWSLYHSFRRDLPTLAHKSIPTLTVYILETRGKFWVSDVFKGV